MSTEWQKWHRYTQERCKRYNWLLWVIGISVAAGFSVRIMWISPEIIHSKVGGLPPALQVRGDKRCLGFWEAPQYKPDPQSMVRSWILWFIASLFCIVKVLPLNTQYQSFEYVPCCEDCVPWTIKFMQFEKRPFGSATLWLMLYFIQKCVHWSTH